MHPSGANVPVRTYQGKRPRLSGWQSGLDLLNQILISSLTQPTNSHYPGRRRKSKSRTRFCERARRRRRRSIRKIRAWSKCKEWPTPAKNSGTRSKFNRTHILRSQEFVSEPIITKLSFSAFLSLSLSLSLPTSLRRPTEKRSLSQEKALSHPIRCELDCTRWKFIEFNKPNWFIRLSDLFCHP